MANANTYTARYPEILERANTNRDELPNDLQELIEKLEQAKEAWEQADTSKQKQLLFVLVQSDACIAAEIYAMYKDRFEDIQVDKIKMMALKAKALKLKWKLK